MGHRAGNARKKKAYKAHFNPDWVKEWPAQIAKNHKGDTDAFCRLCRCDFSVSSGESKTHFVNSLIVTTKGHIWFLDWAIQVVLFSKIKLIPLISYTLYDPVSSEGYAY